MGGKGEQHTRTHTHTHTRAVYTTQHTHTPPILPNKPINAPFNGPDGGAATVVASAIQDGGELGEERVHALHADDVTVAEETTDGVDGRGPDGGTLVLK